jgi:hypothetical protein
MPRRGARAERPAHFFPLHTLTHTR